MAIFSLSNKNKAPNGATKSVFSHVVAHAVMSCYIIMGIFAIMIFTHAPDINHIKIIENIFVVITITVGAFLALAKDIFNPRREIQMSEVMDLAKFMSTSNSDMVMDKEQIITPDPRRKSRLV